MNRAIEVEISFQMQLWIDEKVEKFVYPDQDKNFKEDRKRIGYTGEAGFWKCFQTSKHMDSTHFDFIYNDLKIDVKTTRVAREPQNQHAIVYDKEYQRMPDIYVFAFTDLTSVWISGWKWAVDFKKSAVSPDLEEMKRWNMKFSDKVWWLTLDQLENIHYLEIAKKNPLQVF